MTKEIIKKSDNSISSNPNPTIDQKSKSDLPKTTNSNDKKRNSGAHDATSRYKNLRLAFDNYDDNKGWKVVDTTLISNNPSNINYVDLFAGAGGLSLGFTKAGYNKLFSNEIDKDASATIQRNWPNSKHLNCPVEDMTEEIMDKMTDGKDVDIVIGGPPCQGFSVAGLRNPLDPRNQMFKEYIRVVRHLRPKFIVLENVPGMLTMQGGAVYKEVLKQFKEIGYRVNIRILEAAEYGAPQLRTRAVFIGNRIGADNPYPKSLRTKETYTPIEDALEDLKDLPPDPSINHEWTRHSKKMEERISKIPPGGSLYETFSDAYKRQYRGVPSMTAKENHGGTHVHYEKNRVLSARELARLQCFPDDFIFSGTMKRAYWQIGNAVPVIMAQNIALAIKPELDNK